MSQQSLFQPAEVPSQTRHQEHLQRALDKAREQGYLDTLDEGLVSLALAQATALDHAETDRKYYAVPQIAAPYLEVLTALKLVPSARESQENDAVAEALRELGSPEIRNT